MSTNTIFVLNYCYIQMIAIHSILENHQLYHQSSKKEKKKKNSYSCTQTTWNMILNYEKKEVNLTLHCF